MAEENTPEQLPDPEELVKLANYRMPFGKHKGALLIDFI